MPKRSPSPLNRTLPATIWWWVRRPAALIAEAAVAVVAAIVAIAVLAGPSLAAGWHALTAPKTDTATPTPTVTASPSSTVYASGGLGPIPSDTPTPTAKPSTATPSATNTSHTPTPTPLPPATDSAPATSQAPQPTQPAATSQAPKPNLQTFSTTYRLTCGGPAGSVVNIWVVSKSAATTSVVVAPNVPGGPGTYTIVATGQATSGDQISAQVGWSNTSPTGCS